MTNLIMAVTMAFSVKEKEAKQATEANHDRLKYVVVSWPPSALSVS